MICPRCGDDHIVELAHSPVAGIWTVFQCAECLFTWRSTEPPRRSDREHYPDAFRMDARDITDAAAIPPVPPLLTGS
ncbi:non-oxidative hydroxyarylic acid decarboxylases subunit D [Afifella sp. JA880]|nr:MULTISPECIES: non-oxidative hydroxyarylic acid decarboxylases subunit D [Afifella]